MERFEMRLRIRCLWRVEKPASFVVVAWNREMGIFSASRIRWWGSGGVGLGGRKGKELEVLDFLGRGAGMGLLFSLASATAGRW